MAAHPVKVHAENSADPVLKMHPPSDSPGEPPAPLAPLGELLEKLLFEMAIVPPDK